jgi:hypothetical protein
MGIRFPRSGRFSASTVHDVLRSPLTARLRHRSRGRGAPPLLQNLGRGRAGPHIYIEYKVERWVAAERLRVTQPLPISRCSLLIIGAVSSEDRWSAAGGPLVISEREPDGSVPLPARHPLASQRDISFRL